MSLTNIGELVSGAERVISRQRINQFAAMEKRRNRVAGQETLRILPRRLA